VASCLDRPKSATLMISFVQPGCACTTCTHMHHVKNTHMSFCVPAAYACMPASCRGPCCFMHRTWSPRMGHHNGKSTGHMGCRHADYAFQNKELRKQSAPLEAACAHLEQCVLQLDVSVADATFVEVLHRQHQLLEKPPDKCRHTRHHTSDKGRKHSFACMQRPGTCHRTKQHAMMVVQVTACGNTDDTVGTCHLYRQYRYTKQSKRYRQAVQAEQYRPPTWHHPPSCVPRCP
jgi:hypothetical protein